MKKTISFIMMICLLALSLAACDKSSCTTTMSIESSSAKQKKMSYHKFNGTKSYEFNVKKDETIVIDVDIVTEEGTLDCYIAKDNKKENAVYEGNDIPTSNFTVTIKESGKYTIHLKADDHKGSYSFDWE